MVRAVTLVETEQAWQDLKVKKSERAASELELTGDGEDTKGKEYELEEKELELAEKELKSQEKDQEFAERELKLAEKKQELGDLENAGIPTNEQLERATILRQEVDALQQEVDELHSEVETLNQEVDALLQQQVEPLRQKVQDLQGEISLSNTAIDDIRSFASSTGAIERWEKIREEIENEITMAVDLLPELGSEDSTERKNQAHWLGKEIEKRDVDLLNQVDKKGTLLKIFIGGGAALIIALVTLWISDWVVDLPGGSIVHLGRIISIFLIPALGYIGFRYRGKLNTFFFVIGDESPPRVALLQRFGSVKGAVQEGMFFRFPFVDKVIKFKTAQFTVSYEIAEVMSKEGTYEEDGRPDKEEAAQRMPVHVTFAFLWPRPDKLYYMPVLNKYVWGSDLLNRARRALPINPEEVEEVFLREHLRGGVIGGIQNVMGRFTHTQNRNNREGIERRVKSYIGDQPGNVIRELGIPPILSDVQFRLISLEEDMQQALRSTEISREGARQTAAAAVGEGEATVTHAAAERDAAPARAEVVKVAARGQADANVTLARASEESASAEAAAIEIKLRAYVAQDVSGTLAAMMVGGGFRQGGDQQTQGTSMDLAIQAMVMRTLGDSFGKPEQEFTLEKLFDALGKMTPAQRNLFQTYFRNRGR